MSLSAITSPSTVSARGQPILRNKPRKCVRLAQNVAFGRRSGHGSEALAFAEQIFEWLSTDGSFERRAVMRQL
jgi:hypothetical protein